MKMFRSLRLMLLAILVCLIPASSYAGVFISVGFAPPVLPVYVQPNCPEPGWMWTPGYWAYGDDGYYWVPGTWVPAPYVGALWTPGYWGFGDGLYVWHPGYWGRHVGYYGGVNYGFGYMGIGFVGGMWAGNAFRYNTAVMHVGAGGGWGGRVYVDRTIVEHNTIVNDRHVAYSGGPGGINHRPNAEENTYMHESHQGPSSFQTQHEGAARTDTSNYASHNGGHPTHMAMDRPMGQNHQMIGSQSNGAGAGKINNGGQGNHGYTPQEHSYNPSQGGGGHNEQTPPKFNNAQPHNNVAPVEHNAPQFHPQPQVHETPQHSGGQPGGGQPQGRQPHGGQPGGGGQPHGGQPQGGGGHEGGGHDHGH
jgi:WXXGXW repeat (2 copies)